MTSCDTIKFMRRFAVCSLLSLAILTTSCSFPKNAVPESPSSAYQHAGTSCVACHGIEKPPVGGAVFASGGDVSGSCLECHDYKENHHPVDFVPAESARMPFPLFANQVRCLTCHEIHGGLGKKGTKNLLRNGPYQDRQEICFRCHSREAYASINPHKMLDDQHRVREVNGKSVCLICHSKIPDPAKDYTEDVRFRADVGFLCWRCHPPMPGEFFRVHFLVTPPARTLDNMNRAQERLYVILPIVPRGRITCSTCHNPHQEGVIQRPAAAKGADTKSRLRLQHICFACHEI
jgi:predicted CXXCH cytochrome family protein